MNDESAKQQLVVGVDGSNESIDALRWAVEEARMRGLSLRVVHAWGVLRLPPGTVEGAIPAAERAAHEVVDHAIEALGGPAAIGVPLETAIEPGDAALALTEVAKGAELLVVGSRGRGGFSGLLLGSVSQQCAQHAPCPVVIVRPIAADAEKRVVVGVDGSEGCRAAIGWAAEEARLRHAVLHVVHAWTLPMTGPHPRDVVLVPVDAMREYGQEILDDSLRLTGDQRAGIEVRQTLCPGSPAEVLIRAAEHATLLVVGSRGRGGFARLVLGSVSQQCAHHAPCPLVIVRD